MSKFHSGNSIKSTQARCALKPYSLLSRANNSIKNQSLDSYRNRILLLN